MDVTWFLGRQEASQRRVGWILLDLICAWNVGLNERCLCLQTSQLTPLIGAGMVR